MYTDSTARARKHSHSRKANLFIAHGGGGKHNLNELSKNSGIPHRLKRENIPMELKASLGGNRPLRQSLASSRYLMEASSPFWTRYRPEAGRTCCCSVVCICVLCIHILPIASVEASGTIVGALWVIATPWRGSPAELKATTLLQSL